jgi:hypothetical protein
MNRVRFLLSVISALLFLSATMLSQTPLQLNVLQRLNVGGTDRMTTIDPAGETCSPEECPSEGQIFYVPSGGEAGTLTLYRFFNDVDHLDSTRTRVPGYVNEGPNGFPFARLSLLGLAPMYEGVNSTGDHALMTPSEQLAGYVKKPLGVYGYPRFGNASESILSLNAGGVEIESNRVYGGALWRWTWNGKQFLSNLDGLRGAYSILFFGGDNQMSENGDGCLNHAPFFTGFNAGATQVTTAVPIANPLVYDSVTPCLHPVVWKDVTVGKSITLNYRGMGPVARYTSILSLPNAMPSVDLYHPISSLDPEFQRPWIYDAETAELQLVTLEPLGDSCETGYGFAPNFGGIIFSDPGDQYAMGIYAVNVSQAGSVTGLGLLRHGCEDGVYSRMDVVRSGDLPRGVHTYNAYMMTGTLEQVKQYMDALYALGVR